MILRLGDWRLSSLSETPHPTVKLSWSFVDVLWCVYVCRFLCPRSVSILHFVSCVRMSSPFAALVTGGAKPQVAASGTDRHATLPARHHHHRVHYAPEVQRRLSEAEYPYFRAGSGPPTPPGRTSASANGVGSAPPGVVGPVAPAGAVGVSLRGDMYNVGYISYPHAELTSFNSNPLATATQRISEHDGHLV